MCNKRTRSQVKAENERLSKKSRATTEEERWTNCSEEEKLFEIQNLNQSQKKSHTAFQYDVDYWNEEDLHRMLLRVLKKELFVKKKIGNQILYGDSILTLKDFALEIGAQLRLFLFTSDEFDLLADIRKTAENRFGPKVNLYEKIASFYN